MSTYKKAGVDVALGDLCSSLAYAAAKRTFAGRRGRMGAPLLMEGGFTGALDMGDYYLVQNEDGVGTKMMIAEMTGKFDTLGYDLLAMVADDAVCVGAEVISVSNTIDAKKLNRNIVASLMKGLEQACRKQQIVIVGGEIAELSEMVNGWVWNATAIGIVEKKKFITGDTIRPGDLVIGLRSKGFMSNGFTLIRYILKKAYGQNWFRKKFRGVKWGKRVLRSSEIYHRAILDLHGQYGKKPKVELKGIAHITGGGLLGNAPRLFGKRKFGLELSDLFPPPVEALELQKMGNVKDEEAYATWNMGTGMILVCNDFETVRKTMTRHGVEAKIIGTVTKKPGFSLKSQGYFQTGKIILGETVGFPQ